jgi:hypothetical protein
VNYRYVIVGGGVTGVGFYVWNLEEVPVRSDTFLLFCPKTSTVGYVQQRMAVADVRTSVMSLDDWSSTVQLRFDLSGTVFWKDELSAVYATVPKLSTARIAPQCEACEAGADEAAYTGAAGRTGGIGQD